MVIDSYSETNQDSDWNIYAVHPSAGEEPSAAGQSFTVPTPHVVIAARMFLKKYGSPTGSLTFKIYNETHTVYGTDSKPTGSPLIQSTPLNIASLTTSYVLYELAFTPTLLAAGKYCVEAVIDSGVVDINKGVRVGFDWSTPTHAGNGSDFYLSGWHAHGAIDICFYVYGYPPLISKPIMDGFTFIEMLKQRKREKLLTQPLIVPISV